METIKRLFRGEKIVDYTYRRVSTKRYKIDVWLWKWTITINCHRKEYRLNGGKAAKTIQR